MRFGRVNILYLAVLTKMRRWAVRQDHALTDNPAAELREQLGLTRERMSEDVIAFDRTERDAFLAAAREHAPRYFPIFFAMSRTGLRPERGGGPCSGTTMTPRARR